MKSRATSRFWAAYNEAHSERICHPAEHDRDGIRRILSGQRTGRPIAEDEVYLEANQVGGKGGKAVVSAVRILNVDAEIATVHVPEVA